MKSNFKRIGFVAGKGRGNQCYGLPEETHLYEVDADGSLGLPMCQRGWNRDFGMSYSIWRTGCGESSYECEVCNHRAKKDLPGVNNRYPRKLKKLLKRTHNYCPWHKQKPKNILPYSPLKPGLQLIPGKSQ